MSLASIFNDIAASQGGSGAPAYPTIGSQGGVAPSITAAATPAPAAAPAGAGVAFDLSSIISQQGMAKLQAGGNGWMLGTDPVTFQYGGRNWTVENVGDESTGPKFVAYDPNDRYGAGVLNFDGNGQFVKHSAYREASNNMLVPLAAAALMGIGLPALMGEAAGGLGGAAAGAGELGMFEGAGLSFGGAGTGALGAGGALAGDAAIGGSVAGVGGIAPSVALTPVEIAAGSSAVAPVVTAGSDFLAAGAAGAGGAAAAGGGGLLSQIGSALGIGGAAAGGVGSWLPAIATVGGAIMNNNAANKAANAQAGAAQAGIDEQRRQFDVMRTLLQPYVEAGGRGLAGYESLAGTKGAPAQLAAIQQLQGTPMWSALVKAGDDAILQNASATGGLRGGNTQDALAKQRALLLTDQVNQQLGRYGALATMGQNSAAGTGAAAMQTGQNVANLLQQQGAAQAGGMLAGNNAIVQGIGGLAGLFSSMPGSQQQQVAPAARMF